MIAARQQDCLGTEPSCMPMMPGSRCAPSAHLSGPLTDEKRTHRLWSKSFSKSRNISVTSCRFVRLSSLDYRVQPLHGAARMKVRHIIDGSSK
jgi:hypothetical protein